MSELPLIAVTDSATSPRPLSRMAALTTAWICSSEMLWQMVM